MNKCLNEKLLTKSDLIANVSAVFYNTHWKGVDNDYVDISSLSYLMSEFKV